MHEQYVKNHHNKETYKKGYNIKVTSKQPKCNYKIKAWFPMEGNCENNDEVYRCDVIRPLSKKVYLGLAEG